MSDQLPTAEPAFPGERPQVDPLAVEAPRLPPGVVVPTGGPVPPDPQPGRVVTPLDTLPHPGDHPWETRFYAPGLDLTAIDRHAVEKGFLSALVPRLPTPSEPVAWLDVFKGTGDPDSPLAETMAFAFAASFDQVAKHAAGRTPLLDHRELLGLLAFGYAACVRLAERYAVTDLRPRPDPAQPGDARVPQEATEGRE